MSKCTFCGSENTLVETPHVELKRDGTYGPIMKPCCTPQRRNVEYLKKHFDQTNPNNPDLEDISKW